MERLEEVRCGALWRQNTPHPGTRREQLAEPPESQRSDGTGRRSSGAAPLLAMSRLGGGGDGVDSATVSFLLQTALKREEEEQEKEKEKKQLTSYSGSNWPSTTGPALSSLAGLRRARKQEEEGRRR